MNNRIHFFISRIVLILFSVLVFQSVGKSQIRFLEPDTAIWRYRGWVHVAPDIFIDQQIMLSPQETIVGGLRYRKVFGLRYQKISFPHFDAPALCSTFPNGPLGLIGLIREDNRKVYYWPISFPEEYLAYDFNLSVGDTLPSPCYNGSIKACPIISGIDSITLNGQYHKRYLLVFGTQNDTIIEGIGLLSNPFTPYWDAFLSISELACYSRNDTILLQRADQCCFWSIEPTTSLDESLEGIDFIYPNPTTGDLNISMKNPDNYLIRVYNSVGQIQIIQSARIESGFNLDLSKYPVGLYYVQIVSGNRVLKVEKVIMSR